MARVDRWTLAVVLCGATLLASGVHAQPPATENLPVQSAPEPNPLLKEPQTPTETFDAVVLLVELGRFDLSQVYLRKFVDDQPSDELLQQLRDKYGTAEFLRLTRIDELKETARPLLDRLNVASRKQAEDPAYIDGLIVRLSGSPLQRETAVRELRNAGVRAVPQMLRKLAATKSGSEQDFLIAALSRMGQPVVPAVIAGLDSSIPAVRDGCIEVLRLLQAEAAIPRLWALGYLPGVPAGTREAALRAIAGIRLGNVDRIDRLSDSQATQELQQRAVRYLMQDLEVDENAQSVLSWSWSDAEQSLVAEDRSIPEATLSEAVRSARDAFLLQPERTPVQTVYLMAILSEAVQRSGWNTVLSAETSPAMETAVSAGVEPLLAVLESALSMPRPDAVWASLQALSPLASKELLRRQEGRASPVVRALNFPDPRVQFAAAMVCLRSDPQLQFSGSTRVAEVLRRALTDPGTTLSLIVDPNLEEARELGTFVNEQGYSPIITRTGREGFRTAAETTGIAFIIVHANIADWALTQTLANLRADGRTAFLPIIVYGPEDVRSATARLIARTGNALFVSESPAAQSFWDQAMPFLQRLKAPPLSDQLRQDFRAVATYWLAELASTTGSQVLNLADAEAAVAPLIQDDELAPNVLIVLERTATASAQTQLANFIGTVQLPIETRVRAAQALVSHVRRFGLLLSSDDVAAINAAWSTEEDPALRGTLAAVVGSFHPNNSLVSERLKRFAGGTTTPTAP